MALPPNRKEIVEFTKKLKKRLEAKYGVSLRSRVVVQVSPNPWIGFWLKDWTPDSAVVLPNELRSLAAHVMGAEPSDWDDVSYGNIRTNSIDMLYSEWQKLAEQL